MVSRSMKRLHVELVLALQFDKAHRWSRRRLRDPLGVAIVVLLRLDVGSNIFRRHQPDVVAVAGEDTANVMGAQHASIPTTQAGSFSANPINVSRLILRRMTTAPDASSPTTLQTFLPRSMPRTEISIPSSSRFAGEPTTPEGGRAIP